MFNPLQIPVRILQTLILGHEASTELAHINASTRRWLDEQPVTAAHPDAVDLKRILDERIEYRAEAKQLGKDAGAYHAALTEIAEIIECGGVSCGEIPSKVRELIARLRSEPARLRHELAVMNGKLGARGGDIGELLDQNGKLTDEITRLRADVERLTTAHDARDDEALKWPGIAGKAAAEIEQLRRELAHARNGHGEPATGDTISLRFENGSTVTGPLYLNWENRPMVRGWYADVEGRTRVPALDGGAS